MTCCVVVNGFAPDALRRGAGAVALARQSGASDWRCVQLLPKDKTLLPIPAGEMVALRASHYETEPFLEAVSTLFPETAIWIFDSSLACAELAPRLACRRKGVAALSVQRLWWEGDQFKFSRKVYSNHLEGTFIVHQFPCYLAAAEGVSNTLDGGCIPQKVRTLSVPVASTQALEPLPESDSLADAPYLIALGRGAGPREHVREAEELSAEMGFAIGFSRVAAMNGWGPMDRLLGVSGAMARPEICIAAGVSGAAAFYAGIEKSGHLLAVNTDLQAPICKHSDVVIQGDCLEFLRLFKQVLEEQS